MGRRLTEAFARDRLCVTKSEQHAAKSAAPLDKSDMRLKIFSYFPPYLFVQFRAKRHSCAHAVAEVPSRFGGGDLWVVIPQVRLMERTLVTQARVLRRRASWVFLWHDGP